MKPRHSSCRSAGKTPSSDAALSNTGFASKGSVPNACAKNRTSGASASATLTAEIASTVSRLPRDAANSAAWR